MVLIFVHIVIGAHKKGPRLDVECAVILTIIHYMSIAHLQIHSVQLNQQQQQHQVALVVGHLNYYHQCKNLNMMDQVVCWKVLIRIIKYLPTGFLICHLRTLKILRCYHHVPTMKLMVVV